MGDDTVFQFEQTMARDEVATYLHEVANKLEESDELEFKAGGHSTTLTVPDRLQFEVEVQREPTDRGTDEVEVEFELEWYEDETGTASGSLEIE